MRKRLQLSPEATYYPRPLYRYLKREYIDSFFARGELFITSYERCRNHEDQTRRDAHEGTYNFHFQGSSQSMHVMRQSGNNSYMLCVSHSSSNALLQRFDVDSHFRIDDPAGFLLAMSKSIPNLIKAQARSVKYVRSRSARRAFEDHEFAPDVQRILNTIQEGRTNELDQVWNEVREDHSRRVENLMSDISYYAKPLPYLAEMEFRMVWTTSEPVKPGLLVQCPEAVQYCSRVDTKSPN